MQPSQRLNAWLLGLVVLAAACSSDSPEPTTPSTTLPEFTSVITAGPEQTGSAGALERALVLAESGRMAEAIDGFDEVISRFSADRDLETRRDVTDAYFNKAVTLTAMGNATGAVETYAEMASRIPDDPDLEITETLALGLVNRGNLLIELGRYDEAARTFDDVLNRFGTRPEDEIQFLMVGAALGKGDALVNLGNYGEAIFVYDAVVVETATRQETAFERMQVAAMVSKGRAQRRAGAPIQAAETLNFVLDAWTGNADATIAQLVGTATMVRAEIAEAIGDQNEPGSCRLLEEGDCILRDRFPAGSESPFLPHIVAFNLPAGAPVYVPFASEVIGPEPVAGTDGEVTVTFALPATADSPESRCAVQFVPAGELQVGAGPADAGTLVGNLSGDRLSAPAESGFIYNLTLSCLFRDPAADNRFGPDVSLINELFGPLPA